MVTLHNLNDREAFVKISPNNDESSEFFRALLFFHLIRSFTFDV